MFENMGSRSIEQTPTVRIWTTVASFSIQVVGVGLLVLMPLIYTQALPSLRISEAPPMPHAPRIQQEEITKLQPIPDDLKQKSQFENGRIITPSRIPPAINRTPEPVAPPVIFSNDGPGVLHGDTSSDYRRDAVLERLIAHAPPLPRPDPPPIRTAMRPSALLEGNLVRRVEPIYPTSARIARIQGQVVLQAIIDRDGRIAQLKASSGNPLLIGAAIDAVRQWRYRPYVLNGYPIEVETQITVNFTLR